ncbi:DNA cytosine methyltransferase [Brevibacillus sp. SYSU BS000544]|uniref:DNA cytosine methyltransferase n=1 Tax=Brevibacillus sp. SYSU BS000544 TaxID=3416443 RepID=UPI003CE57B4D
MIDNIYLEQVLENDAVHYNHVEVERQLEEDRPRVNDFFCGAGGMGLGFKQAGFDVVGAWDVDRYAVATYKENVGSYVLQKDITEMTYLDIPYAEVWTFGFPCQDLSYAGRRVGLIEGKRSSLFFEVMRLLDETIENQPENLPYILLAENVKGLKTYLSVLEEEFGKRGYSMYAELFNSKYWGVPQNRERYFVVGVNHVIEDDFTFPEQMINNIPNLSSILEPYVDEKYYIDDQKAKTVLTQAMEKGNLRYVHATATPDRIEKRQNGRRSKSNEEVMFTLTTQDIHGVILHA